MYDALAGLTDKGRLRRSQLAGSPARYENRVDDNHHTSSAGWSASTVRSATRPGLTAAEDSGYEIDEAEVVY